MDTLFAHVLLPLPLPGLYTYRVPRELNEEIGFGKRVVVPFGKSKRYSALVIEIKTTPPKLYEAKYLEHVLDEEAIVSAEQVALWRWMASYYMCTLGEIMSCALPGGFRLDSETKLMLAGGAHISSEALTDREYLVVEALELNEVLSMKEVSEILSLKTIHPIVKKLIEKGVVQLYEEAKQRYKPKKVDYIGLAAPYQSEKGLQGLFDSLTNAPAQQAYVMKFVELNHFFSAVPKPVLKKNLIQAVNASPGALQALVKKEIFLIEHQTVNRIQGTDALKSIAELSTEQGKAYKSIKEEFTRHSVVLLHGVTGSGKTEVYMKMIDEELERGGSILYLLPEIALTTQIITRLKAVFGKTVGVFHSRMNEHERVEVWNRCLNGDFKIIIGARSSVFLPFTNLSLVIIDEEHEPSFKQYDPSPRYHARDTAILLASRTKAKTLLGSATPSVESYWNAQRGKYGLVELNKRFSGVQMPEVQVADVKDDLKKKKMHNHFTELLFLEIEAALEAKEQVILFQNRRGFSPYIQCETCGWTPYCKRCDVGLNYHKYTNKLKCHYCGYQLNMPVMCDACGSKKLTLTGFGTEKIEEDLELLFPKAKVARMDFDTTRGKHAYERLIEAFEERQIDILVGTQMVSKGLDFDHVSLVGVLSADQLLNFQHFRAFERSYQLMTQVAGRAGRKQKRGKVIIQSFQPYHTIIRQVMDGGFKEMYREQLLERRNFKYPPFYKLIHVSIRHRDRHVVDNAAAFLGGLLRKGFGDRVLGPEYPAVARIRNRYHKDLLIKIEREASLTQAKQRLQDYIDELAIHELHKKVRVVVDVDPQ